MQSKTLFIKCSQHIWIGFFKYPVYPYVLTEDCMIVCLELHSSKKVILCSRGNAATYKLSGISLEYDTVFDEHYMEQRQAKCMLEKHSFYTLK